MRTTSKHTGGNLLTCVLAIALVLIFLRSCCGSPSSVAPIPPSSVCIAPGAKQATGSANKATPRTRGRGVSRSSDEWSYATGALGVPLGSALRPPKSAEHCRHHA